MTNGFNATKAYMAIYKCSSDVAESNGHRLMGNAGIKDCITKKRKELSDKYMITKQEIIEDLIRIKDLCKDEPKSAGQAIKALEVINKMLGLNEPDKVESTSRIIWNEEPLNEDENDEE